MTTTVTEFEAPLKEWAEHSWKSLLALGIGAVILGVIVLIWPGRTTLVMGILFGLYLVIAGLVQLWVGATAQMSGAARALTLITGALMLILGIIGFRNVLTSVVLLGIWIGIGWIMAGVTFLMSGGLPGAQSRGWAIFNGIILLVGGVVLIAAPIHSLVILAVVAGIVLVIDGIVQIVHALQLRKALRAVAL